MPSELEKYIEERLTTVGKASYEAIKETVTTEAKACFEEIKQNTPVKTGGLQNALKIEETNDEKKSQYGYKIYYDGYNDKGVPFSLIGNTLNKGTSIIPATRHITKAVKKLRGMDDRIHKKFLEKVNREEGS